jgi:hypothetical protein
MDWAGGGGGGAIATSREGWPLVRVSQPGSCGGRAGVFGKGCGGGSALGASAVLVLGSAAGGRGGPPPSIWSSLASV